MKYKITYEREGIKIVVTEESMTFHKNGLKIEVPGEIFEDFGTQLHEGTLDIERFDDEEEDDIVQKFEQLFKGLSSS